MKKTETYTQCLFENQQRCTTVGWIPSWAARKGNSVQLLDIDGKFWTIREVYGLLSANELQERSRDYKSHQGSLKGGGIDEKTT